MRRVVLWLGVLVCGCSGDPAAPTGDVRFLEDPASGMCMPIPVPDDSNGGSGGGMDDPAPWSDWKACENPCDGLDEKECSADPRCKPRYDDKMCPPGAACPPAQYAGCDANPQPDACLGLDEKTCSSTPGCAPVWGGVPCDCPDGSQMCACPAIAVYRGCHSTPPEPEHTFCYSDSECKMGQHCTVSDGECKPPPGCDKDPNGGGVACPAVCTGVCIGDDEPPPVKGCWGADEKTCVAQSVCEPVYTGSRCFCDDKGCGCLDYTFDSCRPRPEPQPMPQPGPLCDGKTATFGGEKRRLTMYAPGEFLLEDDVAKCPDNAECVWSGVITNRGKWYLDAAGVIMLVYQPPQQTFDGLKFPERLIAKGCDALVEVDTGRTYLRTK